ncbi:hypothetical protein IAR50_004952 [Cryptococcus sp. DSM 104548]
MSATVPLPDAPWPAGTDPADIAKHELTSQVRDATEWATNSDPSRGGFVDMGLYRSIQEWVKNPDALNIIDGILQQRLTMAFPANHKALLLTQLLPRDRLAPYAPLLKPLTEAPEDVAGANFNFFITTLATSLYTLADLEAKKAEAKKEEEEEARKKEEQDAMWEQTAELYGWGRRPEFGYGGYGGGYGGYPPPMVDYGYHLMPPPMPGGYASVPLPEAAPPERPRSQPAWFPPISQDDWWVGKGKPGAKAA